MTDLENAPELIGRYELLTRLATGGMAELFLARERGLAGLERLVVVKRILPHLADQPSFVDMFLREARIVARLSHPNVVQIYELGQEANSYHIAMEYIHGSTVRELLLLAQKQDRQMPCDVTCGIIEQACRGLDAAHELCDLDGKPLGLVHRDVSPHNLMCTTDGHVKLLDFGVAKSTSASVEATYSGNLKGKFAYLSPEQCLHEPLDRRSDVFAMGIVMWEMFTMRRLFKRKTELEMMQAVIGGDVPPPKRFRDEVPDQVQDVVLRALATDRDDRYETAEAMRVALVEAAESSGLVIGEDKVGAFLEDVAGERLAERQATVERACERELTVAERRQLLHLTGADTFSETGASSSVAEDGPTVVERPGGTGSTRRTPAERIDELVEADRRRRDDLSSRGDTDTETAAGESEIEGGSRYRRVIMAAAAVMTIVTGVGLMTVFGEPDEPRSSSDQDSEAVFVDDDQADSEVDDDRIGSLVPDEALGEVSVSGPPLPLGWAPTIDPEVLEEEVRPLHHYLEKVTGRPVPMVIADDYRSLSRKLRRGEVAAAMLPPTLYVITSERDEDVELVLMREFDGTASSDGHLLVRRGGDIHVIDDLEGRIFCFVDRASTSGHLLPRHYLRRHGHDPDEFVGDVHWSGDHFQAMRDLVDGKCAAAAVYSGAYLSADEYDIRTGRMSSLALTGRLPQDVIAVSPHLDKEDRDLLVDALAVFDPLEQFGVERLGRNQRITGFLERDDRDFDTLRTLVREEGIELDDL